MSNESVWYLFGWPRIDAPPLPCHGTQDSEWNIRRYRHESLVCALLASLKEGEEGLPTALYRNMLRLCASMSTEWNISPVQPYIFELVMKYESNYQISLIACTNKHNSTNLQFERAHWLPVEFEAARLSSRWFASPLSQFWICRVWFRQGV
jgi:hypothetical protein